VVLNHRRVQMLTDGKRTLDEGMLITCYGCRLRSISGQSS